MRNFQLDLGLLTGDQPYRTIKFADNCIVPVGPPMPNYGVYLLDENSQLVLLDGPVSSASHGWVSRQGMLDSRNFLRPSLRKTKYVGRAYPIRARTESTKLEIRLVFSRTAPSCSWGASMRTQFKLRGIHTELGEVANSILPTSDGILSNAVV